MRDLQDLFDLCDLIVGRSEDRVPEQLRSASLERMAELRNRASQAGSTLVLAIAGGTGSGKSSLLNAIAGEEVATTGRLRPHTQEPTAWIPVGRDLGLDALLDELDIGRRHRHEALPGLALIDMPDVDSVESDHRTVAERVMASVDGLLWVLDPEKYHDPVLHGAYLGRMVPYASHTTFVLNKIDLLGLQDFPRVVADAATVLANAGYAEPKLFPAAAAPASGGEPEGIEPLTDHLAEQLDAKRVSYGKLIAAAADVVRQLGVAAGVWGGGSIRFSGRWTVTREAALAALRPASRAPTEDALCRIEDLVAAAAAEIGGPAGDEMRHRLNHDVILDALTAAQTAVGVDDRGSARTALEDGVAASMRDLLWDRSYFAALVTQAHIGARQMAVRHGVTLS